MNKKLLIISPYFPPSNTADMQRVRMSLPYFAKYGWDAEVVTVDEQYSDMVKDDLLLQSIPAGIKIHKVKALNKKWTSKIGLGSIALRSLWYYKQKVNRLLKDGKYDLIYFSTTQFAVCILGAYWKKKFGIPYVIDMQDPWHSEYYRDKPKHQQPPKYWLSYRLNKYMEPIAIKGVDGLISVSGAYIKQLKSRYAVIKDVPAATITFGAFKPDMEIAEANKQAFPRLLDTESINIVYIGRGGADMHKAISPVFKALQLGLQNNPKIFQKLKFYFIGTSYAPAGMGKPSILPLAKQYGVEANIVEITDRINYYHTLTTLQQADALFIPGSDDPQYTASKVYPYLLTKKPLLAIFHPDSSAVGILKSCTTNVTVLTLDTLSNETAITLDKTLSAWAAGVFIPVTLTKEMDNYSAENLTYKQTELFDKAIHGLN
ncbi:MAG: glycosyltransferase [Bacteroidota bacterium]